MLSKYELQDIQNLSHAISSTRSQAAYSLGVTCRNMPVSPSSPLSPEQKRQRNQIEVALINALRQEREPDVRCVLVQSLAEVQTPSALQAIASVAYDPATEVRYAVCHNLYRCWEPQKDDETDRIFIPKYIRTLELILSIYAQLQVDPDPGVRMLAEGQYDSVERQLNLFKQGRYAS